MAFFFFHRQAACRTNQRLNLGHSSESAESQPLDHQGTPHSRLLAGLFFHHKELTEGFGIWQDRTPIVSVLGREWMVGAGKQKISIHASQAEKALDPLKSCFKVTMVREFPRGPVVRTLPFHCKGHGFDPWLIPQDAWRGRK